jgi:hypothetical protein
MGTWSMYRSHLQEDDVGVMALYDGADRPYPSVHGYVLAGPDIDHVWIHGLELVLVSWSSISHKVSKHEG